MVDTFMQTLALLSRRLVERPQRMRIASAVALAVLGWPGLPTASDCKAGAEAPDKTQKKEPAPMAKQTEYGFRHDPMQWVEEDRSLQGAMVRTLVLGTPKRGDKKLIQGEIDKILAKQLPDGRLDDDPKHGYQFTAGKLIRLAEMGCPAGRAEVKKAVAAILGKKKPNQADPYGIYDVRAFCLLGLTDQAKLRKLTELGLRRIMAREAEWSDISEGCPWTPIEHLITLWHGRDVTGTKACVARALKWIARGLNPAGCLSFKDPWGFVRLASVVDHPLARTILQKEVPVILRGQRPDGGWGDRSVFVFRALHKHGLLEPLRKRPALPPDWRIVKSIPAPAADCFTLAWDGARLWTRNAKTNEAIAVSPDDGKVVRRLKLPAKGALGIGTWDGDLAVTDNKAKKLLRVDAETGKIERTIDLSKMDWINGVTEVGGKLAVGDGFQGCVMIYDPAKPAKPTPRVLGGPIPVDLATDGAAVWHVDVWAPALIKSALDRHGHLLDWGEKPFDGRCDGIAFDGKHLWALDKQGKRICALERTTSPAKGVKPQAAAAPAKAKYPQVLLEDAVKAFDELIGRFKEHAVAAGDEVYVQPYVYLSMHVVEMRAAGWKDADFDILAAVSGASALFGYEPRSFMPKYAHLLVGPHTRIAEATGFGYEWVKFKDAEHAWRIIKQTVDSGRVAKGWHYENCAFVGYQEAERKDDRTVYAIGDGPDTFSKWWTWKQFTDWVAMVSKWNQRQLGRHTKRVRQVAAKKLALRVMNDLVAWSTDPPEVCRKRFPKAAFGLAGIERYAADCANIEKFKDWSACHPINPQWTIRNSTAVYLERVAKAKAFARKVSDPLLAAAKEYRGAFGAWKEFYKQLGHKAPKGAGKRKTRRQAGAAAVRKWLQHEKKAVAELRLALVAAKGLQ